MVKRPYKVTDRLRQIRKGIVANSLNDLRQKAMEKFGYVEDQEVYLVLEEDGTELDDEEYFQSLPDNSRLMLLLPQDPCCHELCKLFDYLKQSNAPITTERPLDTLCP